MNVALYKNCCNVRVETASEQEGGKFYGLSADKPWGINDSQGMQVHNAMENVAVVLARDPIDEGAQIVAEVHCSGGLDTRQDARHGSRITAHHRFLGLIWW